MKLGIKESDHLLIEEAEHGLLFAECLISSF